MSIFSTSLMFEDDDHADGCAKWITCDCADEFDHARHTVGSPHRYLSDDAACTCKAGPIVYNGSHILPSDDDPRVGEFDLGDIPGHICRTDRPPTNPDEYPTPYHPWLRVSLRGGPYDPHTVILDRAQVVELRDSLTDWLDNAIGGEDA